MSEGEQIEAFVKDIEAVIDRYRAEFNLRLASAVGVLEIVKLDLIQGEKDS
jgi:hypothetical protein